MVRFRSPLPGLQPVSRDEQALVDRNVARYARVHRRYERRHPEIFNPIEQQRLHDALGDAIELARATANDGGTVRVLDLGCGSGNVTNHLVELGADVTASDVSPEFLQMIERRFGSRVSTLALNGVDLANVEDESFDLVTAYSVLHHILDYVRIVGELARVLRPGGVMYLDHEVNENFWDPDGCVGAFRIALRDHALARPDWWNPVRKRWQRFLIPENYVRRFKLAVNPEWYHGVEGDIHVWPGDHIEWADIETTLSESGCEVLRRIDYLAFDAGYPREVYERFSASCSDMRLLVARKTA